MLRDPADAPIDRREDGGPVSTGAPEAGGASSAIPPEIDGLPMPRRAIAASAVILAVVIMTLDTAMIAVALPAMARDLGLSAAASTWIVNSFLIVIVATLLPLAALGEAIGNRKVYLAGLGLFLAGSVACYLSSDFALLMMARLAQGLGAAGVMAVNGALVRFIYPGPDLRKGISVNAMMAAISSAAGPAAAGLLLTMGGWRLLFGLEIPLTLLSLLLGLRTLPGQSGSVDRIDGRAAVLTALSMGLIGYGLTELVQPAIHWSAASSLALGCGGIALLVRRLRNDPAPLLPLDLLRVTALRLSYAASICVFAAQMVAMIALPFFLHAVHGYSATTIGTILSAWPVGIALGALVSARLKYPLSTIGLGGLTVFAAGMALLAAFAGLGGVALLAAGAFVSGAGFGLFQTPNNSIMILASDVRRSGAAAGMQGAARVTGQMLGAALAALCLGLFGTGSVVPLWAALVLVMLAFAAANARLLAKRKG